MHGWHQWGLFFKQTRIQTQLFFYKACSVLCPHTSFTLFEPSDLPSHILRRILKIWFITICCQIVLLLLFKFGFFFQFSVIHSFRQQSVGLLHHNRPKRILLEERLYCFSLNGQSTFDLWGWNIFYSPEENEDMQFFLVRNSLVSWQDFIQADRNKTRSLTVWHHWYNWGGDYTTYHSGRVKPLYRKMSELSSDDRFRILEIKKSDCQPLWQSASVKCENIKRSNSALARQLKLSEWIFHDSLWKAVIQIILSLTENVWAH